MGPGSRLTQLKKLNEKQTTLTEVSGASLPLHCSLLGEHCTLRPGIGMESVLSPGGHWHLQPCKGGRNPQMVQPTLETQPLQSVGLESSDSVTTCFNHKA